MSWRCIYDKQEKAVCACGKGFVTRCAFEYRGDYGRVKKGTSDYMIDCVYCAEHYHLEKDIQTDVTYLVLKGKTIDLKTEPVRLPFERTYAFSANVVALFTKAEILSVIEDMRKSRYSTCITLETSQKIIDLYYRNMKSKNLSKIVLKLEKCLQEYDLVEWNYPKVQAFREKEKVELKANCEEKKRNIEISFELKFK